MKVALILSGHYRTFASNLVYFKQCVMNDHDSDVYLDLWDTYGYWYPDMVDGFNKETDKINPDSIKDLLKDSLKHLNIDNWENHRDFFIQKGLLYEKTKVVYDKSKPDGASRPANLISLWYKRYKGVTAMNESGVKYDHVVLTRPDVRLKNTIDLYNGNLELANSYADHSRGYADIFFNGSQQQITDLAEVYNHMEETLEVNMEFCGHSLMKWWLPKKQIPFEIKSYEMELINTPQGYCKL